MILSTLVLLAAVGQQSPEDTSSPSRCTSKSRAGRPQQDSLRGPAVPPFGQSHPVNSPAKRRSKVRAARYRSRPSRSPEQAAARPERLDIQKPKCGVLEGVHSEAWRSVREYPPEAATGPPRSAPEVNAGDATVHYTGGGAAGVEDHGSPAIRHEEARGDPP